VSEGRRDRPGRLLAATAIPLLGAAALALAIALTHRATPTTQMPAPLPPPVPTPTVFPSLLVAHDDFALTAPRAYGAISGSPAPVPPGDSFDVTLAATPTGVPDVLPVWRLIPAHLDPGTLGTRFGLGAEPYTTPLADNVAQWPSGLSVDAAQAIVSWTPLRDSSSPRLGGFPRDAATALSLAARWLDNAGLAPPAGSHAAVEQTSNGEGAAFAEWTITWPRTATGYPRVPIDQTFARVSADGTLKELELARPTVSGGSLYPLRPWQDALADARRGHWFRLFQPLPEFSTPGVVHTTVTISIEYADVRGALGTYAVPMYAFSEAGGGLPGLVPALAP